MARVKTITVRRAAKINTGNYENTDVSIEMTAELSPKELDVASACDLLMSQVDTLLREKIDSIELGQRKEKSKAGRFGV